MRLLDRKRRTIKYTLIYPRSECLKQEGSAVRPAAANPRCLGRLRPNADRAVVGRPRVWTINYRL